MRYHLNCLDESVFIAVSKPLLTEFGIHQRLESYGVTPEPISVTLENETYWFRSVLKDI